jgi:hypothetical protein
MMHAHTRAHILQPLLIFNLRRLEVQGDGTVGVARSEDENEQIDGMVIIVEQLRAENEQLREAILHLPIDKDPMRFNGAPATCETADIGCTASPVPVSSSTMMTSSTTNRAVEIPTSVTYRLQFTAPPSSPSSVSDPTPQTEVLEFVANFSPMTHDSVVALSSSTSAAPELSSAALPSSLLIRPILLGGGGE